MSAVFEIIPETIIKLIKVEQPFVTQETQFLRPGNVKYTATKVNFNKDYYAISSLMDLSTCFDMLTSSKRMNIYQLCRLAVNSISNKESITLILSLRSLLERLAYCHYFVRQCKNHPITNETDFSRLQEDLFPIIIRGLFQTSSEIRDFDSSIDLKSVDILPYEKRINDSVDRKPLNILTPIKQLDKKVKGVWNAYILLSEYLHPNFGDLELATTNIKIIKNEFGDPQLQRCLVTGYGLEGISANIVVQAISIVEEACQLYLAAIKDFEDYSRSLKKISRSAVHELLKDHKSELKKSAGFRKGTKCPCLSGKRIMDCLKSY